jgi:hypothetical protein
MAERAIADEVSEQASAASKAGYETKEVHSTYMNAPVHESAKTSVKEAVSNPVPPPVRDCTLGGIDYYPISENVHYKFSVCYILFNIDNFTPCT